MMLQLREKRLKITFWTTEEFLSYCFFLHTAESGSIKKVSNDGNKKLNHKLFTKLSLNKVHIWIVLVGFSPSMKGCTFYQVT
jgi:hypothetical protein